MRSGIFIFITIPDNEVTVCPHGLGGDPVDSGAGESRAIRRANARKCRPKFSLASTLCPSDWLREEIYGAASASLTKSPRELGLPPRTGHEPDDTSASASAAPTPPEQVAIRPALNMSSIESQKAAVTWDQGPLLVDAGPGTGKTRTLVQRIKHFLEKGSLTRSILALTFSNKAAEEMRERLRK